MQVSMSRSGLYFQVLVSSLRAEECHASSFILIAPVLCALCLD